MQQPQRAQRFHQPQFARLEFGEVLIAGNDVGQLVLHGRAVALEQHPDVLDRRRHSAVIEVNEMRARCAMGAAARVVLADPQHIAAMAVAVGAQQAHLAGALIAAAHAVQRQVGHRLPCGQQVGGNAAAGEQPVAWGNAEGFKI
ncbi:hypothetical protein D3C85_1448260 [compost metagenome]